MSSLAAQRLQFPLEPAAVVEVVERLQALVARQTLPRADGQRLGEAAGARGSRRRWRAPCPASISRVEGAQGFLQRGVGIVVVGLVEVDVVGLQALQRVLHRLPDIVGRQALAVRPHFLADLGGDDHPVAIAAALQPLADDGLGFAALVARGPARIDVRGVDQLEAGVDEGVEQPEESPRPRSSRRRCRRRPAGRS